MNTRELLAERYGDELLFLDPAEVFDRAIVGVVHGAGKALSVVYDEETVLQVLVDSGMTADEADEYFLFNTAGAYVGERTPLFFTKVTNDHVAP